MKQLTGIAASPGLVVGPVYLVAADTFQVAQQVATDVDAEVARLDRAVAQAVAEIEALRHRTEAKVGAEEARVFEAHGLMLQDPALLDAARDRIRGEQVGAEWAFHTAGEEMAELLATLDDPYLRERAADVRDVTSRVVRILAGRPAPGLAGLTQPAIVVAHDLTPSETAQMDHDLILGFATDVGGPTSHTVIMARTLGIPAVVGLGSATQQAAHGGQAVLDGSAGHLTLDPQPAVLQAAEAKLAALRKRQEELKAVSLLAATNADGEHLELAANIGRPQEAVDALRRGAEGVGLFRTEFLYMEGSTLPSEEAQYQAYRAALETMAPRPVIIRTLDIGGDKQLAALPLPQEMNPFLGLRAIRICLAQPDLFKTQLRALLRAAAHGRLRIMYPMIQSLQELQAANALLAEAEAELGAAGIPTGKPEVGIMVEIPAAAVIADLFAPHVDFFSIGTNDLIQYTVAADRMNERVSALYQPYHPAVLRLIRGVCAAGRAAGKWTGMCGEMAGDPVAAPVLLGLGLQEWSMSAPSIPAVKEILRLTSRAEAEALTAELLGMSDPVAIRLRAAAFYQSKVRPA